MILYIISNFAFNVLPPEVINEYLNSHISRAFFLFAFCNLQKVLKCKAYFFNLFLKIDYSYVFLKIIYKWSKSKTLKYGFIFLLVDSKSIFILMCILHQYMMI